VEKVHSLWACKINTEDFITCILRKYYYSDHTTESMKGLHVAYMRKMTNTYKILVQKPEGNRGGQNNGSTKKLRYRFCVGYIERTSVGNTECSSSVCLHSVVLV
jgi:hypothetical protein